MAEQAVVGVRNAADGKAARRGNLAAWTPAGDVAKRGRNPKEGAGGSDTDGGQARRTLKEREAHEGMKPFAKADGGRRAVDTAGSVGNDEGVAGVGNPMFPPAERIQHPAGQ